MAFEKCRRCGKEPSLSYRDYIIISVGFNNIEKDVRRIMFCNSCLKEMRLMGIYDILKIIIGAEDSS